MAVTLKCPDCGHSVQADDETPQTCPQCEGTMTKPKYKAKSGPTSSDKEKEKEKPKEKPKARPKDDDDEEDEKPKAKARPKPRDDDDEEDEKPKAKAKPKSRDDDDEDDEDEKPKKKPAAKAAKNEALSLDDDDDDDDKGSGDFERNGKSAERIGIDPGFKNKALMKQVGKELSRGEVLHWASRPSVAVAKKQAVMFVIVGIVVILVGVGVGVAGFMVPAIQQYAYVAYGVAGFIVFIGLVFMLLAPKMTARQARMGWYAVTDRRALVFQVNLWGKSGRVESYEPAALRKMWIKKSGWVTGAGSLIFKTEVHDNTTRYVDRRTGRTVKTTGSRTEHHYGFLGIEDVKDVETLVHDVLLHKGDEDEDEDEKEDDDD